MALTQIPIELSSTPGIVDNSNATAITIDSSENVLVGKTSTANLASDTTAGHTLYSIGIARHVASESPSLQLTRTSSDGDIAVFTKDGTTVGSIGTTSAGNFAFFTPSEGGIETAAVGILPMNDGVRSDNETDLGFSGARFKDLYLSGGVYLGGTGSANKLDDYEEGTWTPTAGISLSVNYANYIKIGGLVYINVDLLVSSGSTSGSSFEISLPFSSITTYQAGAFSYQTSGFDDATVNITTTIGFRTSQSGSNMTFAQAQGKRLIFSATYKTAA